MFQLPNRKDGCDDNDALLVSIQKINKMIKALSNKLPCCLGSYNTRTLVEKIKMEDLITELLEYVGLLNLTALIKIFCVTGENGIFQIKNILY